MTVLDNVVCMRVGAVMVRMRRQVEGLVLLTGPEERGMDVDDVLGVPAQRHDRALRIGDLDLECGASEEVVVEPRRAMPVELDGGAPACAQVGGVDAARDDHDVVGLGELGVPRVSVARRHEGPRDLGEAALDVVDEVRPPAEPLDTESAPAGTTAS